METWTTWLQIITMWEGMQRGMWVWLEDSSWRMDQNVGSMQCSTLAEAVIRWWVDEEPGNLCCMLAVSKPGRIKEEQHTQRETEEERDSDRQGNMGKKRNGKTQGINGSHGHDTRLEFYYFFWWISFCFYKLKMSKDSTARKKQTNKNLICCWCFSDSRQFFCRPPHSHKNWHQGQHWQCLWQQKAYRKQTTENKAKNSTIKWTVALDKCICQIN